MARPDKARNSLVAQRARHAEMALATDTPPLDTSDLRFDYDTVDEEHRQQVIAAAVDIKQRGKRATQDVIAIGKHLIAVKELLPHGSFERWIATELDYNQTRARDLMNIAKRFGDKSPIIDLFSTTAMGLLAGPSVPDEVVTKAIEATESVGRPLKVREVRAIRDGHRPPTELPPAKVVYTPPQEVEVPVTAVHAPIEEVTHTRTFHIDVLPPKEAEAPLTSVGSDTLQFARDVLIAGILSDEPYTITNSLTGEVERRNSWTETLEVALSMARDNETPAAPNVAPAPALDDDDVIEIEPGQRVLARFVRGDIPLDDLLGDFDYTDSTLFRMVRVDIRSGMFERAVAAATAEQLQIALGVLPVRNERRRAILQARLAAMTPAATVGAVPVDERLVAAEELRDLLLLVSEKSSRNYGRLTGLWSHNRHLKDVINAMLPPLNSAIGDLRNLNAVNLPPDREA